MSIDKNLVLDLDDICRLCLSKEGIMLPIFENDSKEDDLPLSSRIEMCASVQISQGDGLPTLVCDRCVNHLDSWYTFKEQCHSSDATLRQYLTSHAKMLTVPIKLETDSASEHSDDYRFRCRISEKKTKQSVHTKRMSRKTAKVTAICRNDFNSVNVDDCTEDSVVSWGKIACTPVGEESRTADDDPLASLSSCSQRSENVEDEASTSSELEFPPLQKKKPFSCSHCPRTFTWRASLRDHEASHSGVKRFVCTVCPKAFYTASQLKVHARTHSTEKPHICSTCGKAFKKRSNMNSHLVTHSEMSPFLCNVCGKRCKTNGSLNSHLLVHSTQKNHVCPECGKSFTWKNCLVAHMKVHRPERPASCEQCGKAFKRREELQRHMRTHTGEKPFACVFCERKFSDKWNLTQHVRLHTGDKPYVCGVCGQAFTHNVTLRNHARQHADSSGRAD